MWTSQHLSNDGTRAIILRSSHRRTPPKSSIRLHRLQLVSKHAISASNIVRPSFKREKASFGTKKYNDALQRAFNQAKTRIYFNPDMTNFVTLTYAGADHTPAQVLRDVKILITAERRLRRGRDFKYVYVMEYQSRGSIHVHMICNDIFTLHVNKNGYRSLTNWHHGFNGLR